MKKLVTLLIALLFVVGCASAGGIIVNPDLAAEYYKTEYWGEEGTRMRGEQEYIGRAFKTYRHYPEKDYSFVYEEVANKDDTEVSLVWEQPGAPILGVCFDNIDDMVTRYDFCGILIFDTEEDLHTFTNDFVGDGSNVIPLIINGNVIPADQFIDELNSQIEDSKDAVIGE